MAGKTAAEKAADKAAAAAKTGETSTTTHPPVDAAKPKAKEESKPEPIDIALLTEVTDEDNEAQVNLKGVYARYYKQTPHRMNDELEKSQLLDKLIKLA